ncbi:CbiQ family ECF transporter T component [Jatrophihabitans sp. YIM 134969]
MRQTSGRLPRDLHPMAWWAWAIGLAAAASRTTNPLLLLLILAAAAVVVTARRTEAPWARAFRYYLVLGLSVIAIRVVFRVLFGGVTGGGDGGTTGMHVLFRLWEVPLPAWMAGVHLGGAVTAESLLGAVYDGVRLATLLCCIGAANALANPKRALKAVPGALHEIGVAVVVAVSVAPQLVESVQRVHRARKLRGGGGSGLRALRSIAMPVLQDALERSLLLAAAMDSRGYGRRVAVPAGLRRTTAGLLIAGLLGLCVGAYGVLDGTAPAALGLPALAVGAALCVGGIALGGRRVAVSKYRPDPWRLAEWAVLGCGLTCAVIMIVSSGYDSANLNPSLTPLSWPTLPLLPVLAVVVAALPAVLAPPPATPASRRARGATS